MQGFRWDYGPGSHLMPMDEDDEPRGVLDAMEALEKKRERRKAKKDRKEKDGLDLDDVWS